MRSLAGHHTRGVSLSHRTGLGERQLSVKGKVMVQQCAREGTGSSQGHSSLQVVPFLA